MNNLRGLLALIIITIFPSHLFAEYLYKDELIHNPSFNAEIEKIGSELYQKSGISLRLIMLKELPTGMSIVEYEKSVISELSEPTILLTFSELDAKVDILANQPILYKYFDKRQVLSPVTSPVQSFVIALLYSDSFETFKDTVSNYGGTILPLLAQKAKQGEVLGKYSGAMFNGYADIAEQIAASREITLESAAGNTNRNSIFVLKLIFYGIILYAIVMIVRRKIFKIRHKNEEE